MCLLWNDAEPHDCARSMEYCNALASEFPGKRVKFDFDFSP